MCLGDRGRELHTELAQKTSISYDYETETLLNIVCTYIKCMRWLRNFVTEHCNRTFCCLLLKCGNKNCWKHAYTCFRLYANNIILTVISVKCRNLLLVWNHTKVHELSQEWLSLKLKNSFCSCDKKGSMSVCFTHLSSLITNHFSLCLYSELFVFITEDKISIIVCKLGFFSFTIFPRLQQMGDFTFGSFKWLLDKLLSTSA